MTPHLHNNTFGFFLGLLMVFGASFILYELHLRIPLLRFLFSGKPQSVKVKATVRVAFLLQ